MKKKRTEAQLSADALRPGRPAKPKGEKQDYQVCVNLTQAEAKRIKKEAGKVGLSLSAYFMECWHNAKGE